MPVGKPAPVPVPVPAAAQSLPLPYTGAADEVVTALAPSTSSTTATLTAWTRTPAGWRATFGPTPANIGVDGVGAGSESSPRTPAGIYPLTQAFGRAPNPGTRLPYLQTTPADWWDENPNSPTYNSRVREASSPGAGSENLYTSGAVYDYAVNIDYNTNRVPGAGSAIFLHVSDGAPTAGCVAIVRGTLVSILRWLDPAARPVIDIGVR